MVKLAYPGIKKYNINLFNYYIGQGYKLNRKKLAQFDLVRGRTPLTPSS